MSFVSLLSATKKIIERRSIPDVEHQLYNFDNKIREILLSRGVLSASDVQYNLNKLPHFSLLKDIDKAVTLLSSALVENKKITVIGDYDVDGASSTALVISVLKSFGYKLVEYIVPDRFYYGYGLSPEIVKHAIERQAEIIVTVDNGIASHEGVDFANQNGLQVLITDHHLPGQTLPNAFAIVNPNQKACSFPSKNLAGVGVAFYVMLALRASLREQGIFEQNKVLEPKLIECLDLVALGTVADVVPLDYVNRLLVSYGLRLIANSKTRPGITALIRCSKRKSHTIKTSDLGFALAPRINAAGRLDDMTIGIECLLSENENDAYEKAQILNELNQERKMIEEGMKQEAYAILNRLENDKNIKQSYGICLYHADWHQGVVGILASRIKEKFHRPVIIFAKDEDGVHLKGSARSIENLHIKHLLEGVAASRPGLINKFGGHAMAAGLTIEANRWQEFAKNFDQAVRRKLKAEDLAAKLMTDGELLPHHFNLEFARKLSALTPWGSAFPEPVFEGCFDVLQKRVLLEQHLKLVLSREPGNEVFDAICFYIDSELIGHINEKVYIVYKLDINYYQDVERLQLLIEHIEPR